MPSARTPVNLLRWIIAPAFLADLALAVGPQLNEAPTAPAIVAASAMQAEVAEVAEAAPGGFVIGPSSREASRIFFRTVYAASENVASGWNGDVATGNAGTTSAAFKDAVRRRVNWFRAMAGVPAGITFDTTYNTKAQKAALMMSANDALSHAPPANWLHYSADGAEAAGKSDIFLGYFGPAAVTGYIEDFGSPNTSAGHRRWILYPQTRTMGTGDIPPDGNYPSANALWVVTPDFGTARPSVRDEFVAWPPPGFVPHSMVFPRWSFAYPGADFGSATVTMQRGGASVPVVIQNRGTGAGEPALVWVWDGLDANAVTVPGAPPANDTPVQVAVNGVVINAQTRNFSYTVTLFDPRRPGADTVLATVSGAAQAVVGAGSGYSCNTIPGANGYQWRTASLTALTAIEGAESGTGNVVVSAPAGYAVISSAYHAGGTKAFHLTTPEYEPQSVTLTRTVLASAGTELKFKSRFQYASPSQVAHVQVSTDDGGSWDTIFTDAGTAAPAAAFSDHTLPLAAYANRTLKVRFLFAYEGDGDSYNGTESNVGWYFDDVSFTNAQEMNAAALSSVNAVTTYAFAPAAAGSFAVQARGRFQGDHLFEWGPVLAVSAAVNGPPKITTHPASRTASVGGAVQFSVVATGLGTLTYQWFHGTTSIPGANGLTLDLTDLEAGDAGTYRVDVTNTSGTTPSNSATLTVVVPNPVATTLAGTSLSESAVKMNGHVEVSAQTVACGFEYGLTSSLGTTASAGSASGARDFEVTLSSLAANATIYYRAFAEVSGGARFRGAVKTIAVLKPIASLNVTADSGGTVAGIPGTVRVGDAVSLVAQPASGFAFTGWTGGRTSANATLAFVMPASLTLVAHFSSSPIVNSAGRYRGLALTTPATHASCGLITVTIAAKGAFTGQAVIGGVKFAIRGVFDADGVAHFGAATEATLPRVGKPPLLLRLHLPPGSANPARILGDVREASGFLATIDAPRAVFTVAKNPPPPLLNPPANWPGAYTADLTVGASTPVAGLEGRGWISATIGKDGGARFVGTLADGTHWTSTQPVAADGTVPIFAALYGGTGSIFGVVQLSGSPVTLASTANWFRPAQLAGTRFTAGWPAGVLLTLDGAAWTPSKPNLTWPLPGLAATAGSAHLWATGPGASPAFEWAAIFALKTGAATVTPNPAGVTATFVITNTSGVFTGSIKTSASATPSYFSGVLAPGSNRARGFLLTPSGSGPVTLLPQ